MKTFIKITARVLLLLSIIVLSFLIAQIFTIFMDMPSSITE